MDGPQEPRWTHIALPVADLDASLAWYARYTPLDVLDHRVDAEGNAAAWLGHRDNPTHPFVLVLVEQTGGDRARPGATLAPFAHLGIELPDRRAVDDIAAQAAAEGCLHWPPADNGAPIGYVCAIRDPDGNVIEFSHDQGVYRKAREVWGREVPRASATSVP